jgi:hypothetical protein
MSVRRTVRTVTVSAVSTVGTATTLFAVTLVVTVPLVLGTLAGSTLLMSPAGSRWS